jgi:hypothetical protein
LVFTPQRIRKASAGELAPFVFASIAFAQSTALRLDLGSWISPAFTAIRFEQNVPISTFGILAMVLVA